MGIREVAAAAKIADDAAKEAERQRILQWNISEGERTVQELLGLPGKGLRAYTNKERSGGEGTTVDIGEGLFVKVCSDPIWSERDWSGYQHQTGETFYFVFVNKEGRTFKRKKLEGNRQVTWDSGSYRFKSLGEMATVIEKMDSYPEGGAT